MRRSHLFAGALVALTVAAWTVSAQAGFTTIKTPAAGEKSIGDVITTLYGGYGGAFHGDGLNYTNGLVTLARVEDTPTSGAIDLGQFPLGGATDPVWKGDVVSALSYGRFTAAKPAFGYLPGTSGGSFVKLMDVTGNGMITPIISPSNALNQSWRWAMQVGTKVISSDPANNSGTDRMVTYEVLNYNHETSPRWLLFFEDGGDFDFNDIAVEVESGAPRKLVIPEPATMLVWLGLASAMGVAVIWRRRRA